MNIPTGYGKSLIYQCIPIVADILNVDPRGTSVLAVISPLKALMADQLDYLESICISAIAVGENIDPDLVEMVKNGYYLVVYCSPESALSTTIWRGIGTIIEYQANRVTVRDLLENQP